MEFYQLKITRKGTKPPVWRRCLVPADTDFAKLAAMLEDILEYTGTEKYEFEFFQKKLRLQNLDAQTTEPAKGSYEYLEARGRETSELLDTEAWFTFRVKGEDLPEYRTDIEKKVTDDEKTDSPVILKETKGAEDSFWTVEMQTKNAELEKKYSDIGIADVVAKKIAELEKTIASGEQEVSFSRDPKVKDYLNSYNKEDLIESAKELGIDYEGLDKEALAAGIAARVLDPEVMKAIFLQADEWEIEAFDRATERKCFPATHKDWKELEWFSNKGYIVAYSDNHAEVPREVISVYEQINTPELQEKCRKLSWMRSCQSMMGLIYAIAPLKIVYRMYRRRDGFRISYEEFLDILHELAEKDDMCIIKEDKLIWKAVLQDNLYERIEEFQGDRDFYIPTVDEVLDYAKHGYPSQNVSYRKLSSFLRDELHLEEEKIEELLYIVYKEFSMDGMLSDIMEEFNKRDIVFDSDRQMERFAPIMMEVNNNTRMLDFRGYTPNEVSRANEQEVVPVAPAMQSFVPMGNVPSNNIVDMQPKKKVYPNDPCPCGSGKKYKKCCGRNK
ncbi:IS1096 element passenger TnpR family protein [Blautia sp. MSJ-19]|uniref:IS1096 element passenger TnpR family protein n=1 Tax=Blautia sp. MSJ-19 TaxID=2841517 RepID=UPI00209E6905|nr:SEC-C metal-binding domain-containing protein [Blautia sp. MSJ-19]